MTQHKDLELFAKNIRIQVLKALGELGFGHLGGAMSAADVLGVLYGGVMNVDPKNPQWEDRDYFVMSKGHAGPALYAALALKGYFPVEQLLTINTNGTRLPSHPDRNSTTGVDMSTGSLGQGMSTAIGIAHGNKMLGKDNYTYLLLGDGESQEGLVWEAAMSAAHYKLDNLTVLLDHNGLQIDGTNDEVMGVGDMMAKYEAFGFACVKVDGHDIGAVVEAVNTPHPGKPLFVCCETHKGHGVSFMEDQVGWHGKAPNKEQYEQAMKELGVSDNG